MQESKLRDILISYERKRDKADKLLEQRKNDVYKQIPKVREIEDEISKVGLEMMKLVLKNPSNRETLTLKAKEKIQILTNEKQALLDSWNVPKGYLDIQYECNLCKDRGFLPNGKKCNCLKQALINESYKMSNLSRMLEKQNQCTYDDSIFQKRLIQVPEFLLDKTCNLFYLIVMNLFMILIRIMTKTYYFMVIQD